MVDVICVNELAQLDGIEPPSAELESVRPQRDRGYWSACEVLPLGLRVPSAGLFCTSFTLVIFKVGAHGRSRTSICSSCYGYPVRNRIRLHAHIDEFGAASGFRPRSS